ncbi:MAG: hypothetical protein NC127_07185 [Muribaculum sp.]|nr:hypothetical protein [Muribaculum sp.]
MELDYAKLDHDRIVEYLRMCGGHCKVAELIRDSVADKLRIYPLIAKMSIEREIAVISESRWGTPLEVALIE